MDFGLPKLVEDNSSVEGFGVEAKSVWPKEAGGIR
jgi:hypothetical protein